MRGIVIIYLEYFAHNGVVAKAQPKTTMQNLQADADNYLLTCFVNYTQRATNFCNTIIELHKCRTV